MSEFEKAIKRLHEELADVDKRQSFGRWLRSNRQEAGLRQADIATVCDIQSQSMSRIEAGITRIGRKHLGMLLEPLAAVEGVRFAWAEDGFTVVDESGTVVDPSVVFVRPVPNGETLDDESRYVIAKWSRLSRSDRALVLGLIARLTNER
jgi:transcriptional regulator with XRE-family HTH domain